MVHNFSSRDALLNERNAELIRVLESERKGEKRLQLAMDGANLSFWDLDINSGVVYVNGRWRTTLGGNEKEIITDFETRLALVHPEDIAPCRMLMQRCRDGLVDTIDIEYRVRDKSGNWALRSINALSDMLDSEQHANTYVANENVCQHKVILPPFNV